MVSATVKLIEIDAYFIEWLFEFTSPCPKHDYGDNNLGSCTKAQNVCLCSTPGSFLMHSAPAELCLGLVPGTGGVWVRGIKQCEKIQVL